MEKIERNHDAPSSGRARWERHLVRPAPEEVECDADGKKIGPEEVECDAGAIPPAPVERGWK